MSILESIISRWTLFLLINENDMNIQDKQHLDICWKVFEEDKLSFIIKKPDFGRKTIVTAPDELDIKNRANDFCEKNDFELVYADCRTITLKEANVIRNSYCFDDEDNIEGGKRGFIKYFFGNFNNKKNKLYVIDHISEIPDSPDQRAIYNMLVYSWKNNEGANVIFVKNSDESIERKNYINDLHYCSYSYYGPIVFDPTIEPSGEQKYVMEAKIEKYKELSEVGS